jgi:hypothetical protein
VTDDFQPSDTKEVVLRVTFRSRWNGIRLREGYPYFPHIKAYYVELGFVQLKISFIGWVWESNVKRFLRSEA